MNKEDLQSGKGVQQCAVKACFGEMWVVQCFSAMKGSSFSHLLRRHPFIFAGSVAHWTLPLAVQKNLEKLGEGEERRCFIAL